MTSPNSRCFVVHKALPEVALGIADGRQRGLVLEHIVGCPYCRRELEQLSALADELTALAPRREPPAGFESRVVERIGVHPPRRRIGRRHLRRWTLAPAAALAATAATVIAMTLAYSSDRRLADQYRAALHGAHGSFFQSARLSGPSRHAAGVVFAYQGSPSWLFYVLAGRYRSGVYREEIVTRSGRTITLTAFRPVDATWGIATPVPVRDIARVTLTRQPSGPRIRATLPVIER
jgi:hypothetical protein